MFVRVVTFRLHGIDEGAYHEQAAAIAVRFNQWPGMKCKLWLSDPETGVYGGIYVFDSRASADASRQTAEFRGMLDNPAFTSLSIHDYGLIEDLTAVTAAWLSDRFA